jgi:2-polyprenyl-3-methyl-5-hydroxy-6-metoxy-1,4-benzoquinol methylase
MAFDTPVDHHRMLMDHVRVMAYRAAIFAAAPGKVVVDLGCGSGILSIFAAQAGARHVYAIEESRVAALASLMFKSNGVADRVTLLRGNSREIELPEKADLVVHEILGTDPFNEGVVSSIADARARLLAPDGVFLPSSIEVCCVGLELDLVPSPSDRILREAQEFAGLYAVNFDPYLMALEAYRDAISLNSGRPVGTDSADRIVTDAALLRRVDFGGEVETAELPAKLEVTADGILDGLQVFFRARLGDVTLTNSPFAPLTSWGWEIRDLRRRRLVRSGETLQLRSRIEEIDGKQWILVEVD